jgi:hypothetical protein
VTRTRTSGIGSAEATAANSFIKALDNGGIYAAGRNSHLVFWNGDKQTELSLRDPLVETVDLTHNGNEAIVLIRSKESGASRLEFYNESARTGLLSLSQLGKAFSLSISSSSN